MSEIAHTDEPMHLPLFGPEAANCAACELIGQCKSERWVPGAAPTKAFNGLMIVGEGPGRHELLHKKPFVGPSGKLLDVLIENAGIDRERTYVTNATLCYPLDKVKVSAKGKKVDDRTGFVAKFPNAVPSCLPRLQAEIEAVRPKCIVALGHAALVALTGRYYDKVKQLDNPCDHCKNARKIGPALKCAVGDCTWTYFFDAADDSVDLPVEHKSLIESCDGKCPQCNANIKRLRPRKVDCPVCLGRKKKLETVQEFRVEYSITEAAGGLFYKEQLPQWLQDYGVEWVICTWHPSWIKRTAAQAQDGDTKKFGGQFAARAVVDHLKKAERLLRGTWSYGLAMEITDQVADLQAHTEPEIGYDVDIETNAKSPWDVTELRCIGISDPTRATQLVVDTRNLFKVTLHQEEDKPNKYTIEILDPPLFEALRAFFIDPKRPKGGQNFGQYDMIVLRRFFGVACAPIHHELLVDHHICYPDEPHDLGHIASELTFTPHWKSPKKSGGALKYTGFTELAEYNARDTRNTSLSGEVLSGHYAPRAVTLPLGAEVMQWTHGGRVDQEDYRLRLGHTVSTALVPIAHEMSYMGMPLSIDVLRQIETERKPQHDARLAKIREMTGRPDFKPTKSSDVAWALFDPHGPCKLTPPVISRKTGAPSTRKDILAKLGGQHELVDDIRIWRAEAWVFSNYIYGAKLILREDGRFHPKWNTTRPVTFRWSTEPNCFTGDTEVLTETGWCRLDALDASSGVPRLPKVAQWREGQIEFVQPTHHVTREVDTLVTIHNQHIDLAMTEDHRCLLRHRKTGEERVFTAAKYPTDWQQLHAGEYTSGKRSLSHSMVVLIAATQADGSWILKNRTGPVIDFSFKKKRKYNRLVAALKALEVPYRDYSNSRRYRVHVERCDAIEEIMALLGPQKRFGGWVLDWDHATLSDFCDEVMYWDGCFTRKNHYASTDKTSADWVQTAFALTGRRALLRGKEYRPGKKIYQVDVTQRDYSLTTNADKQILAAQAQVYCVSVPSSYLLVRRNGKICVTGNCQNIPEWLRAAFVAPEGWVIVGADESQLELRIMAVLSGDPELIRRCKEADEKQKLVPEKDPHSFVSYEFFGSSYTDLRLDVPSERKDRERMRYIIKSVIYAMNYGAGARKMRDTIYSKGYSGPPISIQLVENAVATICRVFPGIPRWRDKQLKTATREQEVRSPILGRWRVFPLPAPDGGVEATVAWNYPIQSCGADIIDLLTLVYYPALKQLCPEAWIMAQVHDAIYTVCPEDRAEEVRKLKEECYSTVLTLVEGAPPMPFVASGKIGKSWKDVS